MNQLFGAAKPAASPVKDTSTQAFMTDVIDASMEVPVIVDFWAPWCGPCKQLGPLLEKAVKAANGAVRMVKLNIDEHPEVPTQMRIQSIPAVYAFKEGRPVDGFVGALPESEIKAFIQRLIGKGGKGGPSPIEDALDAAKLALADGDQAMAEKIYRQILQREKENVPALIGLARAALARQDVDDARRIVSRIPATEAKSAEITSINTAIELAEQAKKAAGARRDYERRLARDPSDHEARFQLASALFASGARQEAITELLTIVKADRDWNEQAARKQILKFFEALGPTDPLTVQSRKRLSSVLFS